MLKAKQKDVLLAALRPELSQTSASLHTITRNLTVVAERRS